MSESYVDVNVGAVSSAGRATAATSDQWSQWASRSETLLRVAVDDAREPAVTSALEEHLSTWNPRMKGLATNADALGTNAVSAANVVANSDSASTAALAQPAATTQAATSHLRRPITP